MAAVSPTAGAAPTTSWRGRAQRMVAGAKPRRPGAMAMAPLHRQLPQARLRQQLPRPPPLRPRGRRAQQPRQDPPRLDEGRRPLAPAVCVCSGSSSSSSSSSSSGSSSGSSRRQRRQEAAAQRTEALCNHFKSDGPALAIGRRYQRIMRPRCAESAAGLSSSSSSSRARSPR
eukprot:scaffold1045_cov257-Prasinococcus_capsulatus_cf.AAC.3